MITIAILFKLAKKDCTSKRGFTILELIIAMVVLGFALTSLLKFYTDMSVGSVGADFRNTQTLLVGELMEQVRSKRYDERTVKVGNNWSTTLGVDSGETLGNADTYDDVDDFNGFTETLSAPYAGFSRSVTVGYVNASNLNTIVVNPSPTPEFKKVTVIVTHNDVQDLKIDTVISSVKSNT
jgi:prepilin-type N-terminal cleavage/methylation domain-containing protein